MCSYFIRYVVLLSLTSDTHFYPFVHCFSYSLVTCSSGAPWICPPGAECAGPFCFLGDFKSKSPDPPTAAVPAPLIVVLVLVSAFPAAFWECRLPALDACDPGCACRSVSEIDESTGTGWEYIHRCERWEDGCGHLHQRSCLQKGRSW
jgi:hypothetical protein